MKKIIGIMSLVLATTTFSQEEAEVNKTQTKVKPGFYSTSVRWEEKTIIVPATIKKEDVIKAEKLINNYRVEQEMLKLDVEKLNIRINQEMLYETPSRRAIERLIDDKVKIYGQLEKNKVDMSFQMQELKNEAENRVSD